VTTDVTSRDRPTEVSSRDAPVEASSPDADRFHIVVNTEGQYSLWRADTAPPPGWDPVGAPDSRERCLDHIRAIWTDMRPRGLAARMNGAVLPGSPPESGTGERTA
jgi:MbtH protein